MKGYKLMLHQLTDIFISARGNTFYVKNLRAGEGDHQECTWNWALLVGMGAAGSLWSEKQGDLTCRWKGSLWLLF